MLYKPIVCQEALKVCLYIGHTVFPNRVQFDLGN